MTDGQYLEQFLSGNPDAFEHIVNRHGNFVYAAAKRQIPSQADDVAQAVFILLVQKARHLRHRQNLAGWLFKATRHCAAYARRTEARRRKHESLRAITMPGASDPSAYQGLLPLLDDAVAALSAQDRDVVLLRYLQGKSVNETAQLLALSPEAAGKRAQRALNRLRRSFILRGHAVPEGSLAALFTQQSLIHAPTPLTPLAAKSAAAAKIAKGVTTLALKIKAATMVTTALIIITATSTLLPVIHPATLQSAVPTTPAAAQSATPTNPVAANPDQDLIRVRGIVLDPAGKPVPGAKIAVPSTPLTVGPAATTTSGPAGRFALSFRKSQVSAFSDGWGSSGADLWKDAKLIATAEGFGFAWSPWHRTDAAGDLVLRLTPDDVPLEGRVLSPEGRPVAGVRVFVSRIGLTEAQRAAAYKKDPMDVPNFAFYLPFLALGITQPIFTDNDGRFQVHGLGRDRRAELQLSSPKIGYTQVFAVTTITGPVTKFIDIGEDHPTKVVTYGAKFELTALPGRSVQGVVRAADTGRPMPGVIIESRDLADPLQGYNAQGLIKTVTDEQGRYVLDGFPKGPGNAINIRPPSDQPYFARSVPVHDDPGLDPVTLDIELHKGVWVTGKVMDKITGEPVPAEIFYTTYLENENVLALPEFSRRSGYASHDTGGVRIETHADGTYRLVAAPGPALIAVKSGTEKYLAGAGFDDVPILRQSARDIKAQLYDPTPTRHFTNAVKEIDIHDPDAHATCDFQLDPGNTIHVTILGTDGKPATGNLHIHGQGTESNGGDYFKVITTPTFDAVGLGPEEERNLYVFDEEHNLGKAFHLSPGAAPGNQLTLQLEPTHKYAGRLLDQDAKPLAVVLLQARDSGDFNQNPRTFYTDAQGCFSTTLPVGRSFRITAFLLPARATVILGPYDGDRIGKILTPTPAGDTDLGDIKMELPKNQ